MFKKAVLVLGLGSWVVGLSASVVGGAWTIFNPEHNKSVYKKTSNILTEGQASCVPEYPYVLIKILINGATEKEALVTATPSTPDVGYTWNHDFSPPVKYVGMPPVAVYEWTTSETCVCNLNYAGVTWKHSNFKVTHP